MFRRFVLIAAMLSCGVFAGLVISGRMRTTDEVVATPQ
jgi:hypothetical protein